MRIISLCPSNTELLAYLNLIPELVAVDDYSDWPEQVKHLPKVGPDLSINMDKVEKLKPDLILASLSVPGMEKNLEELDKRKLTYIVLNPQSLDDIADDLLTIGKVTNKEEQANSFVQSYKNVVEEFRNKANQIKNKKRIFWEWWPKPIFTPGKTNWLTEISELAGAENVFATEIKANVQTDWEDVVDRNPEHICMVWVGVKTDKMDPNLVRSRNKAELVEAIQDDAISVLEESLFCRPSPRLLVGLQQLANIIHPNHFLMSDEVTIFVEE